MATNVFTINKTTGAHTILITGEPSAITGGAYNYVFATPGAYNTTRKLYAISNGEFWYETSAGVMGELTAASGDMTMTTQLMSAEAYEKVFIANGSKLKVADFHNIRLTSEAKVSANVPAFGAILTQATSGASISVDLIYYDTTATDHYIYGRNLDTGTWNTTNNVLDSDSNVIITGGNLSAVTTGPLWYDWVPYNTGEVTTYDGIPGNAQIVCTYRGRLVVAGDTSDPNQWYMSRQGNPFDWAYTAVDAQSPISGEAGDMAKAADIVRALIPYKDDYLIIGGESSMAVMSGDPADNGSLDTIDETVGIYGSKAYCFDGAGNLYFWGTNNALNKMPTGFGSVTPISKNALPDISDYDPTSTTILLSYDVKRMGILVAITTRATGVNSEYFYDLRTGGFYPESYPVSCAPYAMKYYPSNDTSDIGMLIGGRDGYIRIFDASTKNDATTSSTDAISSYVCLAPISLAEEDMNGMITDEIFELGGGAASGSYSDTDGLSYKFFVADDYETVAEKLIGNGTARESGTLSGSGRQTKIRKRIKGAYLGIRLYNSTASETWAINKIFGKVREAGKIR